MTSTPVLVIVCLLSIPVCFGVRRASIQLKCEFGQCQFATLIVRYTMATRSGQIILPLKKNPVSSGSNCYFIQNNSEQLAAISNCNGFIRGFFEKNGKRFRINYDPLINEYVISRELFPSRDYFCSTDTSMAVPDPVPSGRTINGMKIIELIVINDNLLFVDRFKKNEAAIKAFNNELINQVNSHYSKINVTVVIKDTINWTRMKFKWPPDVHPRDKDKPLTIDKIQSRFNLDYLMANKEFNSEDFDGVVFITGLIAPSPDDSDPNYKHTAAFGITGLGSICKNYNSMVVMAGREDDVRFRWDVGAILTHELGHMIGLDHVNSDHCDCRDSCVMKSKLGSGFDHWSQCSLDQLPKLLNRDCFETVPWTQTPKLVTESMATEPEPEIVSEPEIISEPEIVSESPSTTGGGAKKVFVSSFSLITLLSLIIFSLINPDNKR